MIIILFIIHVYFYTELYSFNISKTLKEEYLDLYITQIDDFLPELTAQVIKETKLDFENHVQRSWIKEHISEVCSLTVCRLFKGYYYGRTEKRLL